MQHEEQSGGSSGSNIRATGTRLSIAGREVAGSASHGTVFVGYGVKIDETHERIAKSKLAKVKGVEFGEAVLWTRKPRDNTLVRYCV